MISSSSVNDLTDSVWYGFGARARQRDGVRRDEAREHRVAHHPLVEGREQRDADVNGRGSQALFEPALPTLHVLRGDIAWVLFNKGEKILDYLLLAFQEFFAPAGRGVRGGVGPE